MTELLLGLVAGAPKILMLCGLGLAVEYWRPAEREQPGSAIVFNFIWILHFVVMTNVLMLFLGKLVPMGIAALNGPLFHIQFSDSILGGLGQFALLLLIHDFCYYWFHRCQHTWSWFWAHHKLHHTEVHMNATTSFRHHWMENAYRIPFIFIPLGLFNIEGHYTALVWDLALVWAVFTHLNMRITMGPFTGYVAGPQVHRIHHSALPQHMNRNFAAFFPIWDRLFGTYYHPAKGEFPPCGMADGEVTPSVWAAHTNVFRDWYRMLPGRRNSPAKVAAKALPAKAGGETV